ncbi:extracellular solute-binding protein [Ideonella sp. 4Y16]|uniref:ABC transporter substrate-binding protein n=1 Tax=Ideonella alba TaxID=2824118 RepID=UPI001B3773EF|nr:extracellular solute-binding protein [Ideonella alba]MBQ0943599.1 extracellular solute-binding protein [Ideonella alba]
MGAAAGPAEAQTPRRLSVAAFPLLDKLIEGMAPRWRERHPGVALEVISRQWMDHHTAMTTALSTASHLPDVMALEIGFVGRFGQGSGLEDLRQPPFNIEADAPRWIRGAYEQGRNRRGELVAAPADVGPGTMFYRADVLDKAGVDPARLSASWDSYLDAGRQIQARTGARLVGHALELKDIVARTGIAPGDGLYYGADNHPQVTSARFVRGFTLARQVRQERLDGRYMIWTNEWVEALRRGRVATALSGAWMAGQLSGWLAPETAGLWRAAPLPEGALIGYGGSSYAIPRRSDPATKALAWDFIRMMTLDPAVQLLAFKQFDAFPTLLATLDDPFFDEPLPFLGGQRARRQWRDTARRLPAVPVHKQNAFAEEVVGGELDKVMDHGKDITQALQDAARLLERRANR